ncbi:MAG: hypothetical protein WA210_13330 [Burkholderiaceae bacterium]
MFLVACASLVVCALAAYDFLAPNAPALARQGSGARILVIEGWLDETELDQAAAAFHRGRYEHVVTTGGPIESWHDFRDWHSYPERAADYLRGHGLEGVPIVVAVAPASAQDRSFLSAVVFREWAHKTGIALDAVDVFSAGVHARRSWLVYRLALGSSVQVGVLAARPNGYEPERWWKTSAGAKTVIGEALSLAWTKCCFWPGPPGSHEERWAVPMTQSGLRPACPTRRDLAPRDASCR